MNRARAVAHIHSAWSYDGSWSLDDLSRLFGRLRCDVVLMTEHDRGFDADRWAEYQDACARATTSRTLLVPGIEYSDGDNAVHVMVWGDLPFLGEGIDTSTLLTAAREHRGVAVMGHPARKSGWQRFSREWVRGLLGVELWNRKQDGFSPAPESLRLLNQTPSLVPFVGLDFHDARQLFPLTMSLDLESGVSRAAVLGALAARRCRAKVGELDAGRFMGGKALQASRIAETGRRESLRRLRLRRGKRASRA
jgi:hypothetical protein